MEARQQEWQKIESDKKKFEDKKKKLQEKITMAEKDSDNETLEQLKQELKHVEKSEDTIKKKLEEYDKSEKVICLLSCYNCINDI